ncbi:hypothetical protein PanWU01x14_349150 [Parasponia andersonii]|uniref:Secreted protein n=1 Tax=Parasponia andersonii TaxID=3476 RepID=A0A2P5ABF8_PARAD|nr:hypothetical protein PanWU01x14_349150 [Parasponia andersonii]
MAFPFHWSVFIALINLLHDGNTKARTEASVDSPPSTTLPTLTQSAGDAPCSIHQRLPKFDHDANLTGAKPYPILIIKRRTPMVHPTILQLGMAPQCLVQTLVDIPASVVLFLVNNSSKSSMFSRTRG